MLARLQEELGGLYEPDNGAPMIERIVRGRDIYEGPRSALGPDLVVVPRRGYDFKGAVSQGTFTDVGLFSGMHTHDDAMLFIPAGVMVGETPHIRDVASLIESVIQP